MGLFKKDIDMSRELRRHENRLIMIGSGVSAFALWTVIRFIVECHSERDTIREIILTMEMEDSGIDNETLYAIIMVLLVIFLIFITGMQIIIGISARKDGLRKKKKNNKERRGYIVLNMLYILGYIFTMEDNFANFTDYYKDFETILDASIDAIINITVLMTMVELEISAFYVKFARKKLAQKEAN